MSESSESVRAPEVVSLQPIEDKLAAQLRGFGAIGILAILIIMAGNFVIAPLSAILVLIWAKISQTPWREIGYVRPASWPKTIAIGIVLGVALKFIMKALVMRMFGAPPVNQAYHFVTGNPAVIPAMLFTMIVTAGFGEETFYRGWMFERLRKLIGQGAAAKAAKGSGERAGQRASFKICVNPWLTSSHRRNHFQFYRNRRRQCTDLDRSTSWIRLAGAGKIFCVDSVVDWKIFFHVCEKDSDIDDVLPGCGRTFSKTARHCVSMS